MISSQYASNLLSKVSKQIEANKKTELGKKYSSGVESWRNEAKVEIDEIIAKNTTELLDCLSLEEVKSLNDFYQNEKLHSLNAEERAICGNDMFYYNMLAERRIAQYVKQYVKFRKTEEAKTTSLAENEIDKIKNTNKLEWQKAQEFGKDKSRLKKLEKENRQLAKLERVAKRNPEKAAKLYQKWEEEQLAK